MPNPTGKGLKPNKKGERRGGRKAGTPNKINTIQCFNGDSLITMYCHVLRWTIIHVKQLTTC